MKGHHDFIELIIQLKQAGHKIHGLIVGGEDSKRRKYAEELRHRIHLEGLDDVITFTGNRSDMREIYAISNVVLSLSTKPESFGRTVLEALTMGVPVVGYDHGGVGEILSALYPQGKVSLNSIALLRSVVMSILSSDTTEKFMHTPHSMTLLAMCQQTIDIYHEINSRDL